MFKVGYYVLYKQRFAYVLNTLKRVCKVDTVLCEFYVKYEFPDKNFEH